MPKPPPLACPVCAALLLPGAAETHVRWHERTATLNGWSTQAVSAHIASNFRAVSDLAGDDDEAPTITLPPVRESLGPRRRPPAPVLAELTEHAELTRALLAELAAYDEDDQP